MVTKLALACYNWTSSSEAVSSKDSRVWFRGKDGREGSTTKIWFNFSRVLRFSLRLNSQNPTEIEKCLDFPSLVSNNTPFRVEAILKDARLRSSADLFLSANYISQFINKPIHPN